MRKRFPLCLGFAALLCCLVLAPPARAQETQVRNGFALSATLGTRIITLGDATNAILLGGLQGGLSLGYKLDRVLLGLGCEFTNFHVAESSSSPTSSMSRSTSTSTFLIIPSVQVAVLRSRDRRVEMIGSLRVGFGRPVTSTSQDPPPMPPPTPSPNPSTPFTFFYEAAPGVRFFAHPHFAIQVLAGFSGLYGFTFREVGNVDSTSTVGTNGLFASVGALGVF